MCWDITLACTRYVATYKKDLFTINLYTNWKLLKLIGTISTNAFFVGSTELGLRVCLKFLIKTLDQMTHVFLGCVRIQY